VLTGSMAKTKYTSLYLLKKSVDLHIFDHGTSHMLPKGNGNFTKMHKKLEL
jgi:hypothetical protein